MSEITNKNNWIILIVDDTLDNLIVAKTVLKFHGATVYTAMNGEEGLSLLQEITPSVILLDIGMPTMAWVHHVPPPARKPGHPPYPDYRRDRLCHAQRPGRNPGDGFHGYISKPFDITQFVTDIEEVINRTAQQGTKALNDSDLLENHRCRRYL